MEKAIYLEDIDVNIFRAPQENLWKPAISRAVFGGQIIGQALVAAQKTVPSDFHLHSVHSYFLRPGAVLAIVYMVERIRDGKSFATRTIRAVQEGQVIFHAEVSFHKEEESAVSHQVAMPAAAPPESLPTRKEILQKVLDDDSIPIKYRPLLEARLSEEMPMDVRSCGGTDFLHRTGASEPKQLMWVRANGSLGDEQSVHRCAAAYFSDFSLLATALYPYPNVQISMMTSLDHSMWFHVPFRADEWMLYECESPRAGGARALTFGRLFKADGTLAVTVAQEGLIRGVSVPKPSL